MATRRRAGTSSSPIEISGAHRDRLEAQADSLDRLADQEVSPAAFADLAKAMGLSVRSTSIQQGTQVLDGNIVVPDGGVWAFQAATGSASPVIETSFAFYLFRLDSLVKGGVPELADIRRFGRVRRARRQEAGEGPRAGAGVPRPARQGRVAARCGEGDGIPEPRSSARSCGCSRRSRAAKWWAPPSPSSRARIRASSRRRKACT